MEAALFLPIPLFILDHVSNKPLKLAHDLSIYPEMSATLEKIRAENSLQVDILKDNENCVISLSGQKSIIKSTAISLMKTLKYRVMLKLDVSAMDVFDHSGQILPYIKEQLSKVESETNCKISASLVSHQILNNLLIATDHPNDGVLTLQGTRESVERAKIEILVYYEKKHNRIVESVEIEAKFLPAVLGRKLNAVSQIANETDTTIYFPRLSANTLTNANIYICGESQVNVSNAKGLIQKRLYSIKNRANEASFSFPTDKTMHLMTKKESEVANVMQEHGCYIEFVPAITSEVSNIQIVSEFKATTSNALKSLCDLCVDLHCLVFNFSGNFVNELSRQNISRAGFVSRFLGIAGNSSVDVYVFGQRMLVYGNPKAVEKAAKVIKDIEEIRKITVDIRISTFLAAVYEEFITGKKNGKINKITKSSGAIINFIDKSEQLLTIEIVATSFESLFDAFKQLLDELPAEYEFFVVDSHHKRIIGVGGKNIQSIMKVYGVYVKFISSDEFKSIGGLVPRDKNVIARTPAKNAPNLHNLYMTVMEQIDQDIKLKVKQNVPVPRQYQMLARRELKGCDQFTIPEPSTGQLEISIHAKPSEMDSFKLQITEQIPLNYVLSTRFPPLNAQVFEQDDFKQVLTEAKSEYQFDSEILGQSLKLMTTRNNIHAFERVCEMLLPFFRVPTNLESNPEFLNESQSQGLFIQSFSSFTLRDGSMTGLSTKGMSGSAPNLHLANLPIGSTSQPPSAALSNSQSGILKAAVDQITGGFNQSSIFSSSGFESTDKRPPGLRISTSQELIPQETELDNNFVSSVIKNVLPLESDNKLAVLLDSLELGKFKQTLADNDVDFEMFLKLTEEDFKELGATMGVRKRLMSAIDEIKKARNAELKSMQSPIGKSPSSPSAAVTGWRSLPSDWASATAPQSKKQFSTPYAFRGDAVASNGNNSSKSFAIQTITSPLSPSQAIGFVDFIPGSTPMQSPVKTSSPAKAKIFGTDVVKSPSADASNGKQNSSFFSYNI